jgi:hypothetical protein
MIIQNGKRRKIHQANWLVLLTWLLVTTASMASAPGLISYQGKLLDQSGSPVADGELEMEFRFYDSCTAGNLLLSDYHPAVQTADGIYHVLLGDGTLTAGTEDDLLSVFVNHDLVCLGTRIGTDTEMVPRQQLVSVPYAFRADVAVSSLNGVEPADDVTWTGTQTFENTLIGTDEKSIAWPHLTGTPPPDSYFRLTKFHSPVAGQTNHPNTEANEQFLFCYNCRESDAQREDLSQHGLNLHLQATLWDAAFNQEQMRYDWLYTSPGGSSYQPFSSLLTVTGFCSNDSSTCAEDADCGTGNTCAQANEASFSWQAGARGVCANNHAIECTSSTDCGGSTCFSNNTLELEGGTGLLRSRGGFSVEPILAGTMSDGSNLAINIFANLEPTDTGGTVRGTYTNLFFSDKALADSQLDDIYGYNSQLYFTGSKPGRDITRSMTGYSTQLLVTQTGGVGIDANPPTIGKAIGYHWRLLPSGTTAVVQNSVGLHLDSPGSFNGTDPIDVLRHYGLLIEDQKSIASIEGDAIHVKPQSGGDATQGNISLAGGNWDSGHFRLGGGHLWMDSSSGLLRFKDGAPLAESDGEGLAGSGGVGPADNVNWTGDHLFQTTVNMENTRSVAWPHNTGTTPPEAYFRLTKFHAFPPGQAGHPNSESDEQMMLCYNCNEGDTHRTDETQHSWNQKLEATYWDANVDREQLEVNWNYMSPGGLHYRPFATIFTITGHCSNDAAICSDDEQCGAGNTCDGANQGNFSWLANARGVCRDNHAQECLVDSDCGGSGCTQHKRVEIDFGTGILRARAGLAVQPIFAGTLSASSNIAVNITTELEPTDTGGVARGVFTNLSFGDKALADSQLSSIFGYNSQLYFTGSKPGRDITNSMTGYSTELLLTQTGGVGTDATPPTIGQAVGYYWRFLPTGTTAVVQQSIGLLLSSPGTLDGTDPVDVQRHYGLLIEDQRALATAEGAAIRVDPQSGGSATQGNIHLAGGSWDDGHIQLGNSHLWMDETNSVIRYKAGTPGSETDGTPLHQPPGSNTDWGTTYWGNGNSANHDTGDEVCALANQLCMETYNMGSADVISCSDSASHTESRFLVLCN